MLRDKVKLQLD